MNTYFSAVLLWSTLSNAQRLGLPTQEATPSSTSYTNDLCTTALDHCDDVYKHELTTVNDILSWYQCKEPILHAKICKPYYTKNYVDQIDELAACGRFAQEHSLCQEVLNKAAVHGSEPAESFKCLYTLAEAKQYDQDSNAQLCLRRKHTETTVEAPLAKASVVGNALGSLFHQCTPKDPTTAKHCLKSSRSFFNPLTFLKCVCDECDAESEYDRFGDCVIIPHCTEYDHCADCGCSGYLCCRKCEGNWTPPEEGPNFWLGDECICPEPFKEKDGQCA